MISSSSSSWLLSLPPTILAPCQELLHSIVHTGRAETANKAKSPGRDFPALLLARLSCAGPTKAMEHRQAAPAEFRVRDTDLVIKSRPFCRRVRTSRWDRVVVKAETD